MKTTQAVNSSQIRKVEYDSKTKQLVVTFKKGDEYSYQDVTEDVYNELIAAPSVGSYFIANIKNNSEYKCEKLG